MTTTPEKASDELEEELSRDVNFYMTYSPERLNLKQDFLA
jgi:hypothetical protein